MLSNSQTKFINSLSIKKFRLKHNRFICEGTKIVEELLQQSYFKIDIIAALPDWLQSHMPLITHKSASIVEISEKELKKISKLSTPNKVLAVVEIPPFELDTVDFNNQLCLYLDDLQDPGNMGTILRIADWFGIKYVISSPFSVDVYNNKVIQASMGAFLRVKSFNESLGEIKKAFPKKRIYGADLAGSNVFKTSLSQTGIIVIGNEGRGIHANHIPLIDERISIPAPLSGNAESLNAAVATGIICACFRNL